MIYRILLEREIFVKSAFFLANFSLLSLGFNVGALIPQGLAKSPNYSGLLNNFMTLIKCESFKEIGEMACVTPARSFLGQTLNTT